MFLWWGGVTIMRDLPPNNRSIFSRLSIVYTLYSWEPITFISNHEVAFSFKKCWWPILTVCLRWHFSLYLLLFSLFWNHRGILGYTGYCHEYYNTVEVLGKFSPRLGLKMCASLCGLVDTVVLFQRKSLFPSCMWTHRDNALSFHHRGCLCRIALVGPNANQKHGVPVIPTHGVCIHWDWVCHTVRGQRPSSIKRIEITAPVVSSLDYVIYYIIKICGHAEGNFCVTVELITTVKR